jgi:hypothetical protein
MSGSRACPRTATIYPRIHDTLKIHATLLNSPHLVHVPGLGALTARGLAGGDLQVLGGHADGALDAEVLGLGAVDELLADLLEGRDLARGEGDADLVDLGLLALLDLLGIVGRHVGGVVGREENAIATGKVVSWIVIAVAGNAPVHTSVCVLDSVT